LLTERNRKTRTNTLHISLNFAPGEKLSTEEMQTIAMEYMKRIGFSEQPFLVYQHHDTNHPHVHIVTTNIVSPMSAINLHSLAKRLSEPARKEIELAFGLVQAEKSEKKPALGASPLAIVPVNQGTEAIKHAITNILGEVLRRYKFSSLEELNLILADMNLMADRGRPGSRMFEAGGLVYSLLDENGHRTGVAIKASDIYGKPTLKALDRKFVQNGVKKLGVQHYTARAVASVIKYGRTPESFRSLLVERRLSLHAHHNSSGAPDRVDVVDHRNGTVFSHQELGIALADLTKNVLAPNGPPQPQRKTTCKTSSTSTDHSGLAAAHALSEALAAIWLSGGYMGAPDEYPLKKKKKRKGPPR
jgi:hypothetical protein